MWRVGALLSFTLVLTPACAGGRERRVDAGPLAIVYVGNFQMRLRPAYRLDGDDGPSLALYPDGTFLRERLVDGEVKVVRGRIPQKAVAKMIEGVTRCMEPLAEVTNVATATIRFHPISMMLVLRPAEKEPIVRVVVDVEASMGQIMIPDSVEHQTALYGDSDYVDMGNNLKRMRPSSTSTEPDFWPCLRPLLHISSEDEAPWTPTTIALVLTNPRTYPKPASEWPREIPLPPRPPKVHGDTTIRHSVPYSHAGALRDLLKASEYVELYGYVWKVDDLWLPWPRQEP